MEQSFRIGNKSIGGSHPCLVIGEVAQAHDGSLGMAHAFVDAIANAGADAVKFQTHIASAESTPAEPWRVKFSRQDATRCDYWRRMEFTEAQWLELKNHTESRGLLFLSSPFSLEAVALLRRLGLSAWKIASGEITNAPLIQEVIRTGQPIFLSTGMSPVKEIDDVVEEIKTAQVPCVVMQCTSEYPCPAERVGLNMLQVYQQRYQCPVGLSDHSSTIYPSLAAVALGASVVEVHVTLSREMFGPDVKASVTMAELRQICDGARCIRTMLSSEINKDVMAGEFTALRQIFTKSIVARVGLPAGTILQEDHLAFKKPGTGLPPSRANELLGRKVKRPVKQDSLLSLDDCE